MCVSYFFNLRKYTYIYHEIKKQKTVCYDLNQKIQNEHILYQVPNEHSEASLQYVFVIRD